METTEEEQANVTIQTKMEFLKKKFYFHELIAQGQNTNHYIVEDLEINIVEDPDQQENIFFYFKQIFYETREEVLYALDYYKKLVAYCKSPFSKSDIINYTNCWEYSDQNQNYFELVVVCNFGESDRIDVEHIEKEHITKFLKNVCILLQDLKKISQLYHGNIFLKNIVLENDELKLSGFKPIYKKSKTWQSEFIEKYDHYKLDMFLMGLLWLKFLNTNIEDFLDLDLTMNELLVEVEKIKKQLTPEQKKETVSKLLDLNLYNVITLDLIILNFNEQLIIENSIKENFDSEAKKSNLFTKPLENEEIFTLKGPSEENIEKQENVIEMVGNNFTLQENDSLYEQTNSQKGKDVQISSVKKEKENQKQENINRGSFDPNSDKFERNFQSKYSDGNYKEDKFHSLDQIDQKNSSQKDSKNYQDIFENQNQEEQQNIQESDLLEEQKKTLNIKKHLGDSFDDQESIKQFEEIEQQTKEELLSQAQSEQVIQEEQEEEEDENEQNNQEDFQLETEQEQNFEEKNQNKKIYTEKKTVQKQFIIEKNEKTSKNDIENKSSNKKQKKMNFKKKIVTQMDVTQLNQQQENDQEKPQYVFGELVKKPPKENPELEKLIQDEIQKKKDEMEKKLQKEKELLKQKYEDQKKKEEIMKQKIRKIADLKKKKKFIKKEDPIEPEKQKKEKSAEIKKNKPTPQKVQKQVLQKKIQQKESLEDLNKKISKKFEISDYSDRAKMFEYNSVNFKNKNIPFKKIFEKRKEDQSESQQIIVIEAPEYKQVEKFETVQSEKQMDKKDLPKLPEMDYFQKMREEQKQFEIQQDQKTTEKVQQAPQQNVLLEEQKRQIDEIFFENLNQKDDLVNFPPDSLREVQKEDSKEKNQKQEITDNFQKNEQKLTQKQKNLAFQGTKVQEIPVQTKQIIQDQKNTSSQKPQQYQSEQKQVIKVIKEITISQPEKTQQYQSENIEEKQKLKFQGFHNSIKQQGNTDTLELLEDFKYKSLKESAEPLELQKKEEDNQINQINFGSFWNQQENDQEVKTKEYQTINDIFDENKIDEGIEKLQQLKYKAKGLEKIEILKNLSILYFKKQNFQESIKFLKEALDLLKQTKIANKEEKITSLEFSLAINYIESNNYEKALTILDKIDHEKNCPQSYWLVKGDVQDILNKQEQAFQSYIKSFHEETENDLNLIENQEYFLSLLTKLVNTLLKLESQEIVKFFNYILVVFNQLEEKKLDKIILNKLQVEFIMQLLNSIIQQEHYDLLNYFLNQIADQKLINISYLTDNQFFILSKIYYQFSLYLKSIPNYGNQKESFVNFLNHSLFLLQEIKQKNIQVNNSIVEILLFKGIFFLQQEAFSTSEKNLKEAYQICINFLSSKTLPELYYTVLYNLGLSYFQLKMYEEALYYFEQILETNCQKKEVLDKTYKQLAKLYYRMGLNQRCVEVLKTWIYQDIVPQKNNLDNFKYLTIYYLCCQKIQSKDLGKIEIEILEEMKNNESIQNRHYLNLFHKISMIQFDKTNFNDNEKYLQILENIIKMEPQEDYSDIFLSQINLMYTKYILNKNEEAYQINKTLIHKLKDKQKDPLMNATEIENFLYNFLLLLISKLPNKTEENELQYRNLMLEKIKQFKESNQIHDQIYQILNDSKFSQRSSEKSIKSSNKQIIQKQNKMHDEIIIKNAIQENYVQDQTKKKLAKKQKMKSQELIKNSNFTKKPKCICYRLNFQKQGIIKLIQEFISQIKNMIYLGVIENLEQYYEKFEKIIKEKRINWEKFIYIKRLFNFHIQFKGQQQDSKKIYQLLGHVIEVQDFCIHDINNIITLLESFQEPIYMEVFIQYLHKEHPSLSQVVFTQLFLQTFNKKFEEMMGLLYQNIQEKKYMRINNYPLMHFLDSPNILQIEKNITFKFYYRLRDQFLNNNGFFQLFQKYIPLEKIFEFYLNYIIYTTQIQLIKKIRKENEILTDFMNRLVEVIMEGNLETINIDYFIYKFLLIVFLLKFDEEKSKSITDQVVQILFFIESKLPKKEFYHYSLTCSLIGNIFFKNKFFEQSVKAKSMAFEALKKMQIMEPQFPKWFSPIKPKDLMKGILSFMMMNHLQLKKMDFALKFKEKLAQSPKENLQEQIEDEIAEIVFQIKTQGNPKFEKIEVLLEKSKNSKMTQFDKKVFEATLENLKFEYMALHEDDHQQNQRKISQKSADEEALAFQYQPQLKAKLSLNEILLEVFDKKPQIFRSYLKPSLSQMNKKRWKEIENKQKAEEFLKELEEKMRKKFFTPLEENTQIFSEIFDQKKIVIQLKDSLEEEIFIYKKARENIYQKYFKEDSEFKFNFPQLRIENITDKIDIQNSDEIEFIQSNKNLSQIYYNKRMVVYFNINGQRKEKPLRSNATITTISYCFQNNIYLIGYDDGIIECFKESFFKFGYLENDMKVSKGKITQSLALKENNNYSSKFLINSNDGDIFLIEITETKFNLNIGKKTLLNNFRTKRNSIDFELFEKFSFALLMDGKRIILSMIDPEIKKIFEIFYAEKSEFEQEVFFCSFYKIFREENFVKIQFYVFYEETLRVQQISFDSDFQNVEQISLKQYYSKLNLIAIKKLSDQLILAITNQFEILFIDHLKHEFLGQIDSLQNCYKVDICQDNLILRKKSKKGKKEYWMVKQFTIEEFLLKMMETGDYVMTLNISLRLYKNSNCENVKIFLEQTAEFNMDNLLRQICKSYYKFLVYCVPVDQVNKVAFGILIEFIMETNIINILNDFYDELNKSFSENIDFICEALLKYCSENDFFNLSLLQEYWINRLIEKAFIQENREFILKLLLTMNFGTFQFIEKILELLKVLKLKYPLIKLICEEKQINFKIIDTLFQIYLKEENLEQFNSVIKIILQNSDQYLLKGKLNYEEQIFVVSFFFQKNILEVYSNYVFEFSDLINEIYSPYFQQVSEQTANLKSVNNSHLYNYFTIKGEVDKEFSIFIQIYEKFNFFDIQKIDILFALTILKIILKKIQNNFYSLDFFDLLIGLSLKNKDQPKLLEQFLIQIFQMIYNCNQFNQKAFNLFLEKYFKISIQKQFYTLQIYLKTLKKEYLDVLEIVFKENENLKEFDLFQQIENIVDLNFPDYESFCIKILQNLQFFNKISKKQTFHLLCKLSSISLNNLQYLNKYPEFLLLIIEQQFQNSFVEFKYQKMYLEQLNKINPNFLI